MEIWVRLYTNHGCFPEARDKASEAKEKTLLLMKLIHPFQPVFSKTTVVKYTTRMIFFGVPWTERYLAILDWSQSLFGLGSCLVDLSTW